MTEYFVASAETCLSVTLNGLKISRRSLNTWDYTSIADWIGESTYSPSENNLEFNWARCIGRLAANRNCRSKISCCYTKQSLNPSGLVAFNWSTASNSNMEILQRFQNNLRIIVNAPWYVNDTLRYDLNVPYVRDEIKRLSQTRYADRMEKHPNILAINLVKEVKTTCRLKKKLSQDWCTWSYCNF